MILPSNKPNILLAAERIRQGNVVAFPTETVYGLGANALNESAVRQIFQLKGRPQDNPLIVHLARAEQAEQVAYVESNAARLLLAAMPLPLSVVLRKRECVPSVVSAGLNTVAVRVPANEVARQLIEHAGVPIAAPSANKSGRPSPTCAQHVQADFGNALTILDGGDCRIGLESTVVDASAGIVILRSGAVSAQDIYNITGEQPTIFSGEAAAPSSPGMKYKHYSPNCEVVFAEYGTDIKSRVLAEIERLTQQGETIGVLSVGRSYGKNSTVYKDEWEYAAKLFAAFRQLEQNCTVIIAEGVPSGGVGDAVNNRIKKASGRSV